MGPEQDLLDEINGNDDYEVIQSKFISTLRVLFESEGISTFTDVELSQWLKVADYHIARAQELIALTLKWRREFGTDEILQDPELQELDNQGILQLFGKAIDQSTILVWNGKTVPIRYVIYKMEQWRFERSEEGLTAIMDISDMEKNKFASYAAQIIPILQCNYPNVLLRMYVFPATPIFSMVFKMALYLVDPKTADKISYEKTSKSLSQWITPDQYFQRFGGLAKDPFDIDPNSKEKIKKTAAFTDNQPGIVELWVAPSEFQNI